MEPIPLQVEHMADPCGLGIDDAEVVMMTKSGIQANARLHLGSPLKIVTVFVPLLEIRFVYNTIRLCV